MGLVAAAVIVVATLATGCRSKECARMLACCNQIKEMKGVGGACGPQANAVSDPKTCRTILKTVGYMFEEREKELPEACRRRAD